MREVTKQILLFSVAFVVTVLLMLLGSPRQIEATQPDLPIQAMFFYPWYPENWTQAPAPFSHYTPDVPAGCADTYPPPPSNACYYDSDDNATIDEQLQLAHKAHVEAFISTWWGQGHHTDAHLKKVMTRANNSQSPYEALRFAIYHEQEGQGDPTVTELANDLTYLQSEFFGRPNYLHVDGKPVVFVFNNQDLDQAKGQDTNNRWADAQTQAGIDVYVVLKVYPGFRDTTNQPESWHQYAPSTPYLDYADEGSINVSPGFWKKGEAAPRLARDIDRFRSDIIQGRNANADWKLVTSWNEWGEGTSVESAGGSDDPATEPAFFEDYIQVLCEEWTQAPLDSFDCDLDSDGDGFRDSVELVIGTDPVAACPINSAHDAWAADPNNDGVSDITDIALIASSFGQAVPPALARYNVAPVPPDSAVDISDIGALAARFGEACIP